MNFWILFGLTVFVVSLIPGPSTLIAFANGARLGLAKATGTALGNAAATILQAIAASAGLGIVLAKSAVLFSAIKYLGAAYLVYMGVIMWRGASQGVGLNADKTDESGLFIHMFRSGFLVAASNPKAIIFFTALFPQFLDGFENAYGRMSAMIVLSGLIAFSVAMIYALLGARLRAMKISSLIMTWVNKITGGLFVSSGVGLAVSKS